MWWFIALVAVVAAVLGWRASRSDRLARAKDKAIAAEYRMISYYVHEIEAMSNCMTDAVQHGDTGHREMLAKRIEKHNVMIQCHRRHIREIRYGVPIEQSDF